MTGPLISAAELSGPLVDGRGPTVLDVRWRLGGAWGPEQFERGHVPGAAYVDLERDLAAPRAADGAGGRHPLPHLERFQAAMRRAGVSQERRVVVYDDWSGFAAARAWWLLRHHGHPDVRVLDGAWTAWTEAGGAVETGPTTPAAGDFVAAPGGLTIVDADTVREVGVLVDARTPERFRGEQEPVDPVAGHIPGAVNVPSTANLGPDGRFRPAAELSRLYAAAGATRDAEVAAYCGSGVTATFDLLALEVAGVRAALYPGSWSDWISDPDRPVALGEDPTR